jgi:hypothetical protein
MCRNEMNETSMLIRVIAAPTSGRSPRLEMPRVGVFDHGDAPIAAHFPVQLAVSDVERDDVARAAVQPHVGESAGRRADIKRDAIGSIDAERVESGRELDSAAPDPRMIGSDDPDVGIDRHHGPGFGRAVSVDVDLSGENQRARFLARLDESSFHQQCVESLTSWRFHVRP